MMTRDTVLLALCLLFIVSVGTAVFAATRIWQLRGRARNDLHPTFRPPSR